MNTFGFLLLCIQACYIQMAFSQYLGTGLGYPSAIAPELELGCGAPLAAEAIYSPGIAPAFGYGGGYGLPGPAPFGGPAAYGPGPAYGGAGIGDVEVAGEMPVAGTTLVTGQVPILGAVKFTGEVPAGGVVSISGRCGCGCNGPYGY